MTSQIVTRVSVYWDNQDRNNEGWAYSASSYGESVASGGVEASCLSDAIAQVIHELDLDITPDAFSIGREEGGYAVWNRQ